MAVLASHFLFPHRWHRRHIFCFRSVTFERRHWFHSNFAELYITIKYRSSSILVIICQILAELWPFFDLIFVVCLGSTSLKGCIDFIQTLQLYVTVKCRSFDIGNHPPNFGWVMALFRLSFCWCVDIGFRSIILQGCIDFLKVCRRIYHCIIQVKIDISNHPQNFGRVMALFRLSFCWCVDIGFRSITFAGMHWFYWKFAEGYIIVKYRSGLILVISHKILVKLVMALFWLSFCCWAKILGKDVVSPQ